MDKFSRSPNLSFCCREIGKWQCKKGVQRFSIAAEENLYSQVSTNVSVHHAMLSMDQSVFRSHVNMWRT
jgi:hypothetical protein